MKTREEARQERLVKIRAELLKLAGGSLSYVQEQIIKNIDNLIAEGDEAKQEPENETD